MQNIPEGEGPARDGACIQAWVATLQTKPRTSSKGRVYRTRIPGFENPIGASMKAKLQFSPERAALVPAVAEYLAGAGYSASYSALKTAVEIEAAIEFPEWDISIFHWKDSSIFVSVAANTVLRTRLYGIKGYYLETCPDGSILFILIRKSSSNHLPLCGDIRQLISEACLRGLREEAIQP